MKNKRFNIIDAFLIFALIALAAAAILSALSGTGAAGGKVSVRYVLETEVLSNEFTSKVAVGDGVFTYDGAEKIGTVSAVSMSPAVHRGTDSEGLPVSSEIDGCSVLYITVDADARPKKTGYAVGSALINTGRETELRLPSLYCNARCISVEETEE